MDKIDLQLNSSKTQLIPLEKGFKLLKWHFYLTETGAVILKMDKRKISKEKAKLKKIYTKELLGKCPIGATQQSLNSWLANANRGNTYFQQQGMINYFKQLEGYYGKHI